MFLKILQYSQENACIRDSNTDIFLSNCEIFNKGIFHKIPPVAAVHSFLFIYFLVQIPVLLDTQRITFLFLTLLMPGGNKKVTHI